MINPQDIRLGLEEWHHCNGIGDVYTIKSVKKLIARNINEFEKAIDKLLKGRDARIIAPTKIKQLMRKIFLGEIQIKKDKRFKKQI